MSDEGTVKPTDDLELVAEYEAAFGQWHNTEDAESWDDTIGDGLRP